MLRRRCRSAGFLIWSATGSAAKPLRSPATSCCPSWLSRCSGWWTWHASGCWPPPSAPRHRAGPHLQPQAAWYAEPFPANVRLSGVSISYAQGDIIEGTSAPMIAQALLNAPEIQRPSRHICWPCSSSGPPRPWSYGTRAALPPRVGTTLLPQDASGPSGCLIWGSFTAPLPCQLQTVNKERISGLLGFAYVPPAMIPLGVP